MNRVEPIRDKKQIEMMKMHLKNQSTIAGGDVRDPQFLCHSPLSLKTKEWGSFSTDSRKTSKKTFPTIEECPFLISRWRCTLT